MDITKGLQLQNPNIFIAWTASEIECKEKFDLYGLVCIATGYYIVGATLFDYLDCKIGFHFLTSADNGLNRIEIFDTIKFL